MHAEEQTADRAYPATEFIRRHTEVLAAVLTQVQSEIVWEDDLERVPAAFVSANWFRELGYGAALGRVLADPDDAGTDAPPVAVISHAFWRARVSAAEDVVGRIVRINDRLVTIVGVAPAALPGLRLEDPRVWLPITQIGYINSGSDIGERWDTNHVACYARLSPGVSPSAAREGLGPTLHELADARPQHFKPDEWLEPVSALDRFRGAGRPPGAPGHVGGRRRLDVAGAPRRQRESSATWYCRRPSDVCGSSASALRWAPAAGEFSDSSSSKVRFSRRSGQ